LLRDMVSNRARVELGKSPGAYHDVEVARFLEAQRGELPAPVVRPPARDPLPSYLPLPDSPPIPDTPGIALVADRVVLLKGDARHAAAAGAVDPRPTVADRSAPRSVTETNHRRPHFPSVVHRDQPPPTALPLGRPPRPTAADRASPRSPTETNRRRPRFPSV